MVSVNCLCIAILTLLLVVSNAFWSYTYFTSMQSRGDALREGCTALAVILAHASVFLREAGVKEGNESLGTAYMLIDHALLVAQALDKLTGGSSWAHRLVSAIASLHDLLASTYQGHTISKNKLMEITGILRELAGALKRLDTESIERYSQRLFNVVVITH